MSFFRYSGIPNIQPFVKTASTALSANGLVKLSSGQVVASAADDISALGICLETIASTDGDYATARPVLVDMVDEGDVLLADVTPNGGTFSATSVGTYYDILDATHIDGNDSGALSGGATGAVGMLVCVGFISATQGLFVLSSRYTNQTVNPTS